MILEIVGEEKTGFGAEYHVLSCGHRRNKALPDHEGGKGADGNLPTDRVWCWHGCHDLDEPAVAPDPLPEGHGRDWSLH